MLKAMLGEAWRAMGANRMRTALTMLGMVIGVGSVVLMMAIGQGAQYAVAQPSAPWAAICISSSRDRPAPAVCAAAAAVAHR
jgi:hypothetical protein